MRPTELTAGSGQRKLRLGSIPAQAHPSTLPIRNNNHNLRTEDL